MRILFNNELNDSIMTATGSSVNYPIENIIHRFLKKRWQSLIPNSVISIVFNTSKTIDSIFYAYHTLDTFSFELFDSFGTSLYSSSDSNIMEYGAIHFTKVTGVKRIEITVSSPTTLRIGCLWIGESYLMPDFLSQYSYIFDDNSAVTMSQDAQYNSLYVKPLRGYEFSFPENENDIKNLIMNFYINKGVGNPFFIDPTELNRNKFKPDYVVFEGPPKEVKNGRMYTVSMKLKEAR